MHLRLALLHFAPFATPFANYASRLRRHAWDVLSLHTAHFMVGAHRKFVTKHQVDPAICILHVLNGGYYLIGSSFYQHITAIFPYRRLQLSLSIYLYQTISFWISYGRRHAQRIFRMDAKFVHKKIASNRFIGQFWNFFSAFLAISSAHIRISSFIVLFARPMQCETIFKSERYLLLSKESIKCSNRYYLLIANECDAKKEAEWTKQINKSKRFCQWDRISIRKVMRYLSGIDRKIRLRDKICDFIFLWRRQRQPRHRRRNRMLKMDSLASMHEIRIYLYLNILLAAIHSVYELRNNVKYSDLCDTFHVPCAGGR